MGINRIKKLLLVIGYSTVIISLVGCGFIRSLVRSKVNAGNKIGVSVLPPYSGPKAHITIAEFDVKTAMANSEIGSALRQILTTVLINSNRFSVIERQLLSAVAQEQGVSAAAVSSNNNEPQKSKIKTADLIITGALTEFEPQTSGGRAGVGGGGGIGNGILGGILGANLNKAHIALDIRIVDASTSEVLATTHLQGQASDNTVSMNGVFGAGGLGAGLSVYANTQMEKATRISIIEAARYI